MNDTELKECLEEGPKESPINSNDSIHNPEFKKEMKEEPWDEYKKEDFQ